MLGKILESNIHSRYNIHKRNCRGNNGILYQIDHMLVDSRDPSNMLDARASRGANIYTDHYLIKEHEGSVEELWKQSSAALSSAATEPLKQRPKERLSKKRMRANM